jgi:hypothetical protein
MMVSFSSTRSNLYHPITAFTTFKNGQLGLRAHRVKKSYVPDYGDRG